MTYFYMALEFIKISFFAFGGGYGTLPFIYYISNQYGWYSAKEIIQMVAVSAVTPGAFGVNMATYTGYKISGVLGAIFATTFLILPSFFLSIGVYKIIKKYRDTEFMKDFLETLRAVSSGLLFVVVLQMFNQEVLHLKLQPFGVNFSFKAFGFLCFSIIIYFLVKKNIILTMLLTIISGTIFTYIYHLLV